MKIFGALLLLLSVAAVSRAQVLVSYEFTAAAPPLPVPVTSVAAGLTASGVSKGTILNVVPNANLISVGPDGGASTAITAVTLGHYIEFTVSPAGGRKLNLGALVFKVRREQAGAMGWVVRSSADNFAADLATEDIPTVMPTFTNAAVTLPAGQFTGLPGPVTFRIYTYQAAALYFADYDDIQLLGQTDGRPSVGVFSAKRVVTTKPRINLTGVAFDDFAVAGVFVNGRPAAGTTNWRAKLKLKKGNNAVRIFAIDNGGAVSDTLTVRVKRVEK